MESSQDKETTEIKSRSNLNKRLLTAMLDPEQVIFNNSLFVVLEDKYPKSKLHILVVPWKDIPTIREVTSDDLELLKMMDMFGREIAYEKSGNRSFWVGYHVEPTMYRLHLHILSTDLCGTAMSSVRHWNSFTTPFFVESQMIHELEKYGRINLPSELECKNFLKTPLKCDKCSHMPKTICDLRKHLPPMRRDLLFWMDEPKAYVHSTDNVLVIKEKHPKAEMHFLVLPKKDIPSIKDVKAEDLDLLKIMDEVGRFIASAYGGGKKFWFGYHAFQLQQRLHLHVISNDLCGTGMNTMWHWNSFTTPFFMKSEEVIDHLAKKGFVKLPTLRQCLGWLNGRMLCHFCTCNPFDVYLLKDHVKEHFNGSDYFHPIPRRKKGAKIPKFRSSRSISRMSSRLSSGRSVSAHSERTRSRTKPTVAGSVKCDHRVSGDRHLVP